MKTDVSDKLSAGFRALRGRVLFYNVPLKKYQIRPDEADYGVIECPALDYGQDSPYAVNDEVLLQRIPNQGWLVMGRIPVSRDSLSNTIQKPDGPADKAKEISFQEPGNDEPLFHAQPGDFVVRQGKLKLILSKIGIFAVKVSDTCARYMSKAKSTITDRCFNYLLSVPRATINLFLDRQTEQPKLEAQFNPQSVANAMRFAMGGGAADDQDGFELAMGQFTRFIFQLLPNEQKITYSQNGGVTQVTSSLDEFMLAFGDGTFTWDATGLSIKKGALTNVLVSTSSIELLAASVKLSATGSLDLSAPTVNASADGTMTLAASVLIMQQFNWLTVVQRLNVLLLAFSAHVHEVGPITSAAPTGPILNEKLEPIGTPITPDPTVAV